MNEHYIAINTFQHDIDCFCPDAYHAFSITIPKGNLIEVTPERKFTMAKGWYVFVVINEQHAFYMAIEDLEQYIKNENILSSMDLDLKINFLQFKIDQDLERGDESSFAIHTNLLNELRKLKVELANHLSTITVG
ncbi:hypothetical protein J7I93_00285 [Bacillus sp. ISL-47]|uniref:hypothetical protein n=1 Tax=Bacillus sp. ISL-47 TaxID=2819130 RepID=UPI001BE58C26|nr:hypothetical protein [Bacillus sp. ISL-47]MBT2686613.1 hypothetical protein [Bacillus sp. ISL-47]MBT2707005.1 hypothetical protein [Pseudomonas sp. ISL-84]